MHTTPSRTPYRLRRNNRLTGTLPAAFGAAWPEAVGVELQRNALEGPLPREWAAMRNLRRLLLQ